MASIYENSFITIAATWAEDNNDACFSQTYEKFQAYELGVDGLYARQRLPLVEDNAVRNHRRLEGDDMPLLGCGWAFQERLLSTRVVHYTKEQLIWECRSAACSECKARNWRSSTPAVRLAGLTDALPLKTRHNDLGNQWQTLVSEYTKLNFTHDSDILPALAGIVKRELQRRKSDLYIARMWRSTLLEDIACKSRGLRAGAKTPTWSWAYIDGVIAFTPYQPLPSLKLLDVQVEYAGPANIGEVITASAFVRGNFLASKVMSRCIFDTHPLQSTNSLPFKLVPQSACHAWVNKDRRLNFECDVPVDLTFGEVVEILVLSKFAWHDAEEAIGIALQQTAPGRFKKVGTVSIRCMGQDDDWRRPTIMCDNTASMVNEHLQNLPVKVLEII